LRAEIRLGGVPQPLGLGLELALFRALQLRSVFHLRFSMIGL
jgi:hypothetical protein